MINRHIKGLIVINCDRDFFGSNNNYANKVIEDIEKKRDENKQLKKLINSFWKDIYETSNRPLLGLLNNPTENDILWCENSVSDDIYFLYSIKNEIKLAIIWQSNSLYLSQVLTDATLSYRKGLAPIILKKKRFSRTSLISNKSKFRLLSFYKKSNQYDDNLGDVNEESNFHFHSNNLVTIKSIIGPLIISILFLVISVVGTFLKFNMWGPFISSVVSLMATIISGYVNNKSKLFSIDIESLNFSESTFNIKSETVEDQQDLDDLLTTKLGDQ